jgi:amidase
MLAKLTLRVTDDAEKYDGAPVGLQIVARKYEEEKVWAIARIIDAILRDSRKMP